MVDNLISGICSALNNEFNADNRKYQILKDTTTQGLKVPAFSVQCIQSIIDVKGTQAYKNSYLMAIHYYSDKDDKKAHNDCLNVFERVCIALKNVKIGHCYNFNTDVADGVLTITCTYNINTLMLEDKGDIQDGIKIGVKVKNG